MLLGNFDGLHRGHKSLVDTGRDLARQLDAPLGIMSCEPHPRQFFNPAGSPFRLTTRVGKRRTFANLGFNLLFEPRFDAAFAGMSPADFARTILSERLQVKAVVVGSDFRFGHERRGDIGHLVRFGQSLGFDVVVLPDLIVDGDRLSSTRIRCWLKEGQLRKVSDSFAGQWMTSVVLDEEGLVRFDGSQCLPPVGIYQVEIMNAQADVLCREILELHRGRCGQLSSTRLFSTGTHFIGSWSAIDVF
ncbi:riboflavin kinase/FMN adenylyltransferase [Neorhizobium galegae]|uniref:hypothetical protein n=1 Tax=Neorhizobium galegae TaxID=399 RepID=UPI002781862A|nr:hypothetical protein [Neorhizobium galegae]MDQ0137680.1 riboflavin kinase/FMN adenylyltransferase [Neorhizobium galegae]